MKDVELILGNRNMNTGAVSVRWCFSQETLDIVAEIEDPQMVLLVTPVTEKGRAVEKIIEHAVVPLSQLETFVYINDSGDFRIHGFVRSRNDFLNQEARTGGTFEKLMYQLINNNHLYIDDYFYSHVTGRPRPLFPSLYDCDISSGSTDISISEQMFAADPPEFLKFMANLWNTTPYKNSCEFRRRLMFAIPFKTPALMVYYALKFIILTMTMLMGLKPYDKYNNYWRAYFQYGDPKLVEYLNRFGKLSRLDEYYAVLKFDKFKLYSPMLVLHPIIITLMILIFPPGSYPIIYMAIAGMIGLEFAFKEFNFAWMPNPFKTFDMFLGKDNVVMYSLGTTVILALGALSLMAYGLYVLIVAHLQIFITALVIMTSIIVTLVVLDRLMLSIYNMLFTSADDNNVKRYKKYVECPIAASGKVSNTGSTIPELKPIPKRFNLRHAFESLKSNVCKPMRR